MTSYQFIFSSSPRAKACRHIAFWGALILHFIIQNLMVGGVKEALKPRSFADSALNAFFFFPVYIFSVYLFIDLVLPLSLFRRKYILFTGLMLVLLIADFTLCYLSGMLYVNADQHIPLDKITFNTNKYNAVVNGIFLPVTFFGISGGIKFAKKWYLQQKENEILVKEKISRELQLLKTQLHPRFLFHSLHTVKTHISSLSPISANLILQLSDLLSYVLYESDKEYQPIEKEIEIIRSYIDLEMKSTGGILTAEINISGNQEGKYISPLILLSFIEISFDCFINNHLKDPSVKLAITIWNDHLDYHLICNRFLDNQNNQSVTRGKFSNLEKQLNLLYPGSHQIEIMTNSNDITVVLNLPIHLKSDYKNKKVFVQNELNELL